jgi:hypothetical protein
MIIDIIINILTNVLFFTEPKYQKCPRGSKISANKVFIKQSVTKSVLHPQDEACISYIGGWLVKQTLCEQCSAFLLSPTSNHIPFFASKTFYYAKSTALTCPSPVLRDFIKMWETQFRLNISKLCPKPNLLKTLLNIFMQYTIAKTFCSEHVNKMNEIAHRYALFRIYAYCKFVSSEVQQSRAKHKLKRLNIC